ncbi:NAD(P)H-hydrate epimerase [Cellulomonas denverensis]|uniref:NAD(P)H-hydrate epimerase n=1 Tax=Cellulomonas denverensis TaxID=264297 RepID=UPI0035ED4A72
MLLVGSGNNGGDTLHAGALLATRGVRVLALCTTDRPHAEGLAALTRAGGRAVLVVDGLDLDPDPAATGADRGAGVRPGGEGCGPGHGRRHRGRRPRPGHRRPGRPRCPPAPARLWWATPPPRPPPPTCCWTACSASGPGRAARVAGC